MPFQIPVDPTHVIWIEFEYLEKYIGYVLVAGKNVNAEISTSKGTFAAAANQEHWYPATANRGELDTSTLTMRVVADLDLEAAGSEERARAIIEASDGLADEDPATVVTPKQTAPVNEVDWEADNFSSDVHVYEHREAGDDWFLALRDGFSILEFGTSRRPGNYSIPEALVAVGEHAFTHNSAPEPNAVYKGE